MQEATAQVANHSRPCSTLMLQALPALAKQQTLERKKTGGNIHRRMISKDYSLVS